MDDIDVSLYDVFCDQPYGGNRAGVVTDVELSESQMRRIAAELGAPATNFVNQRGDAAFEGRFFAPSQELAMCGHGVVGAFTSIVTAGQLGAGTVTLHTGSGEVVVEIEKPIAKPTRVMMSQPLPQYEETSVDITELASILDASPGTFETSTPPAIVTTATRHLLVRAASLEAVAAVTPDYARLGELSRELGVVTVALFTTQTVNTHSSVHSRDFCPAVGVPEFAASGTTTSALGCHLVNTGLVTSESGEVLIVAEQGYEMGRPSRIDAQTNIKNGQVTAFKVGGSAVQCLSGKMRSPGVE